MMFIREAIGLMLMLLGLVLMILGIIGVFKFKNFYARVLVVSKVDTIGIVVFMFGIMVRHGFSFFSGKVLLIVVITLILGPLVAHMVARSAYLSNYAVDEDGKSVEGDDL